MPFRTKPNVSGRGVSSDIIESIRSDSTGSVVSTPDRRKNGSGQDFLSALVGQDFATLLYEGCKDVYQDHLGSGSEMVIPSFESNECEMRGRRPDGLSSIFGKMKEIRRAARRRLPAHRSATRA